MFPSIIYYVLLLIFLLITLNNLLPEIMLHILGIGSWKRQYSPGVAITFDDGPDPLYTPQLLKILREQQVKASFFLVGKRAQAYPELVKEIEREGHLIGSHGFSHTHSWLLSPYKTWQNLNRGIEVLAEILGHEPELIRPPWGASNLTMFIWSKLKGKRLVCWSISGRDWEKGRSPSSIINALLPKTCEGTIILLHDSGGAPGSPENTLACLPELFRIIRQELKLPLVPLQFPDWLLSRRISFRLWERWEHFYAKINNIKRIDDHNLFRLALSRYQGPDLYNEKGDLVATKGDRIGEIHFDNIRFQAAGSNLQAVGIRALKQVRLSLPELARYIINHPEYRDVKVYLGFTMLNRGARGLGFQVEDYPYHNAQLIGLFQKLLLRIYHPAGNKRKTHKLGDKPKMVWISSAKLLEIYHRQEKEIS